MRTIEIDEDTYQYLVANVQELGEPAWAVLRRVLGLEAASENGAGGQGGATPTDARAERLDSFVGERMKVGNVTRKYIRLLAFLCEENPERFERVLSIRGRKRRYFARSEKEIEASGTHTHPKKIPGSGFWAMTNADTDHKREILRRVLQLLDYEPAVARRAVTALR